MGHEFQPYIPKATIKELPNHNDIEYGDGDMSAPRGRIHVYFLSAGMERRESGYRTRRILERSNDHSKGVVNKYDEAEKES